MDNKISNIMIENLNVSKEIKKLLSNIDMVASSGNSKMKTSIKDLFISSPSCKELSKIAKCYERIITNNGVYPVRGSRTYLELAFPATGNERDYKEFFASPRLAAATQDYFTGVFLISFEQWMSANDLIRDIAFENLIKFINDNKEHISFVFHVLPDFKDCKILCNELGKHLNLYFLEHNFPDLEAATIYVEKQLKESGIEFDISGKREIKKIIQEKIDMDSNSYKGYTTLEQFVANLQFEVCVYVSQMYASNEKEWNYVIGENEIRVISDNIDIPNEEVLYRKKIGFI